MRAGHRGASRQGKSPTRRGVERHGYAVADGMLVLERCGCCSQGCIGTQRAAAGEQMGLVWTVLRRGVDKGGEGEYSAKRDGVRANVYSACIPNTVSVAPFHGTEAGSKSAAATKQRGWARPVLGRRGTGEWKVTVIGVDFLPKDVRQLRHDAGEGWGLVGSWFPHTIFLGDHRCATPDEGEDTEPYAAVWGLLLRRRRVYHRRVVPHRVQASVSSRKILGPLTFGNLKFSKIHFRVKVIFSRN